MSLIFQGASSLVLWYGGYLVWHKEIDPGTLISLMLYTLNLAMSFAFLSNLYGEFMQVSTVSGDFNHTGVGNSFNITYDNGE